MVASPTSPTKSHILQMRDDRKSSINVLFAVARFSFGEKFLFITDRKADSAETSQSRKQPRKEIKPVNKHIGAGQSRSPSLGPPRRDALQQPGHWIPHKPPAPLVSTGGRPTRAPPGRWAASPRWDLTGPPPCPSPAPAHGDGRPRRKASSQLRRGTRPARRRRRPPPVRTEGRRRCYSPWRPLRRRSGSGADGCHRERSLASTFAALLLAAAGVRHSHRPPPPQGVAQPPCQRLALSAGGGARFSGTTAVARRELALGPDPVSPLSPPAHAHLPPPPPPNCAVASQARLGDGGRSVELRVPSFPMETGAGGGGSKQVGRSVRGAFCNIWGFGVGRLFGFFSWCHQEIKELFSFWDSLLLSLLRYERGRESPGEGRPGSWMEVSKMNGNPLKS